jgi:hypothetical protein
MKNILMTRKNQSIYALIILCTSCVFIHMDDSIDLGGRYRYLQDYPQSIIYHESSEYEGIGTEVIPGLIKDYEFNKRYIIAKSKNLDSHDLEYWIIDKEQEFTEIHPLDSLTFFHSLINNKIELSLK